MKRFVSSPENLAITEALINTLRELPVGGILKKEQIENLVKDKPHLLSKARDIVEKKHGCAFGTIRGVGLKKLTGDMIHTVGEAARGSARRKMTKAHNRIIGVIRGAQKIDRESRLKATSEAAKLGLALEFLE